MFGALQLGLGLTSRQGGGLPWYPNRLFQSGDILLWYDPSDLTTMFQDTTGVTPVTADGQSVAIVLDKGQWEGRTLAQVLAAQTDKVVGARPFTGIPAQVMNASGGTLAMNGNAVRLTIPSDTNSVRMEVDFTGVVGRYYKIVVQGATNFGLTMAAWVNLSLATPGFTASTSPNIQYIVRATGTACKLRFYPRTQSGAAAAQKAGDYVEFSEISIRELPGYHREQATGTSMPKYKTDGTLHWLLYDGTDDSMQTSTIAWGTDEFVLCGGLYKASDAASGMYAELSASVSTTNGSAYLANSGGAPNWSINSRGTLVAAAVGSTGAAPNTAVLTGQAKISTDYLNLRGNGASIGSSSSDQGTGNYGSHVLNFGRRNNASLPVNGREYQTVIRSRLLSAAELSSLETFIAAKTGVIL